MPVSPAHLHLRQLPDHLNLLLKYPPQGLFGCSLVVELVLLQVHQLLTDAVFRLVLRQQKEEGVETRTKNRPCKKTACSSIYNKTFQNVKLNNKCFMLKAVFEN